MANFTGCALVHEFSKHSEDQCEFVRECEDCHRGEGFIPYITLIYCLPYRPYLPLAALLCVSLYLFAVLAITANDFLCPSLVAISKKLGLSQAVAGVTFLAIGNGAPDIIAAFTAINQERSALVISELFGAGTFVTAVVGGYIFFSSDFTVDKFSFIRDVVFYLAAAALAFALFKLERVTVYHAALFVAIYALYIALVLIRELVSVPNESTHYGGHYSPPLAQSALEGGGFCESDRLLGPEVKLRRPSGLNVHHQNAIKILLQQQAQLNHSPPATSHPRSGSVSFVQTPNSMISREFLQRSRSVSTSHPSIGYMKDHLDRLASVSDSSSSSESDVLIGEVEDMSPWKELWIHIAPISYQDLKSESLFSITWRTVALPIQVCLALTVPVVDYEHEKDNWCRALNVIHCITAPMAMALIVFKDVDVYDGVPLFVFIFPLGLLLASLVVISSEQRKAPRYHFGFALLAFATAVCFIYAACRELMTVLKALGLSQNIDDSVLGLTVLAWGSSMGDMITDSTVAKQGYPSMAIAAAFAGPMLNLIIGFGLSFSAKLVQTHETTLTVQFPSILFVLYAALNCSLILSVIFLSCNKFRSSTTHAIALWLLYGIFIVTALTMTIHSDMIS
ncbi:mitochondrial sodium/calcium exchanger protein [Galendromus occidentalis]|uniref:Mitochondrial sodium/calcium exchanger protein n=1 Tax=Galendromus occidentalis TaxID=34638 RepID=A0AAJ6QSN9_9ACAR|nr:mitochondrial sodium/calcium exchanger protein [Galendromus occidentalis]